MARITKLRWAREGVLSALYDFELIGQRGTSGKTLVRFHNRSDLLVRAKLNCNFRLYGEPIMADALYSGKMKWLLFPQQMSQGWFELETLVQQKGKTVATMIAESTSTNRKDQFTMNVELEFWDEQGEHRNLPGRHHYFDFDRWAWIPELAERESA